MTYRQYNEANGGLLGQLFYGGVPDVPVHQVYDMEVVTSDDFKEVLTVPSVVKVMWCHKPSGQLFESKLDFIVNGCAEAPNCTWSDLRPVLVIGGC